MSTADKPLLNVRGTMSLSEDNGSLRSLGSVNLVLRKTGKFKYDLQILSAESNNLLLQQPVTPDMNLRYGGANSVDWILVRPNRAPQRLVFAAADKDVKLRELSIALVETQLQQDFNSVFGEDAEWAIAASATPEVPYDSKNDFSYDEEQKKRRKVNRMDDEDDDVDGKDGGDDDGGSSSAFKTPMKRGPGGGAISTASKATPAHNGLTSSTRKGKEQNSLLVTAMNLNRSFVSRGSQLGVLGYDDDGELEHLNRIPKVKDASGQVFTPAKLQLHSADTRLLMLGTEEKDKVYNMDLETGKVIDEWHGKDGMIIKNIAPTSKYAQTTNDQLVVGVNDKGLFTLDPRLNTKNKIAIHNEYSTKVFFSSLATNTDGFLAVASEKGDIRLYDKLDKRAKTQLPGLGNPVTHLDVTADGEWLLATTKTYLVVYPLKMSNGRLGFNDRMGQEKPIPLKLMITPEDMLTYGINEVNFTPAFFNTGTIANTQEMWIATSTGQFVITWNFLRVKQGQKTAYQIAKTQETVVMDRFRHNYANDLLVAQTNDVYMSRLKKPQNN